MDREIVSAKDVGQDGGPAEPYQGGAQPDDEPQSDLEAQRQGAESDWKFWSDQLQAALGNERRWRAEADQCEELYFGPDEDPGPGGSLDASAHNATNDVTDKHALIHGTVDVLRPLVYSQTPQPIVRRRFRGDGAPVAPEERMAAEVGQRIASFVIDDDCFDHAIEMARDDWLISGRGQARVTYDADVQDVALSDEQIAMLAVAQGAPPTDTTIPVKASEKVKLQPVEWRRFLTAPGHGWDDAPWVAFEFQMTEKQIKERFGEDVCAHMSFNKAGLTKQPLASFDSSDNDQSGLAPDAETNSPARSLFDTAPVWEIWVREAGQVVWFSEGYKHGVLDREDDPLELQEFYPCPRPLTATTKGNTLLPRPDIRYYEKRADEINIASRKMHTILEAISVSGLFPGQMEPEVKKLLNGSNQMIGIQDWIGLMEKGGSSQIIQWLPLQHMMQALEALNAMRDQAKAAMFEASGVSDVMRAQGDPSETATAQKIKGRYAGLRMKERQKRMAIFARDCINLMLEVAIEHFEPEYLHQIVGMDIPLTEMERQAVIAQNQAMKAEYQRLQQLHQQLAQAGIEAQPPQPPQLEDEPEASFEKVLGILRNDLRRKITVTIETDSTVLSDEQEDKEARVEFLSAFASFVQQLMPLIQSGQVEMKLVKELLLFGVRGFPQSRTLEGMIGELPEQEQPQEGQKDPSIQVAEIKAQVDLEIEKMQQANNEADRAHEMRMKGVDIINEPMQEELRANNAPEQGAQAVQQQGSR